MQGVAVCENLIADFCHRIGNEDRGQVGATGESLVPNGNYGAWDRQGGDGEAIVKGSFADGGEGVGKDDGG